MNATVIDTLRYADRLKGAGVEHSQAEAMSRALNDELVGGVATKDDLTHAVVELKAEIAKVDAKFEAKFDTMDAKFDAMNEKFDAKFDAMDEKFEALNGKTETQGRYVFLVLALIAALGLYNAVAPHFAGAGKETATSSEPKPAVAAAAAPTAPQATTAPYATVPGAHRLSHRTDRPFRRPSA